MTRAEHGGHRGKGDRAVADRAVADRAVADRAVAGEQGLLALLAEGRIDVRGRIPWSSNATFLVEVHGGRGGLVTPSTGDRLNGEGVTGEGLLAIYKPAKGERPLWDFPRGLWRREVAAYELAKAAGWDIVPPTVGRADGPLGPGSLQYWVDALDDEHYFTLLESPEHRLELLRVAVFDLVTNNADRKGGHFLLDRSGHVWAIDHGLCFHAEAKLRTVAWDFAGEMVPGEILDALEPLGRGELPGSVLRLLDASEVSALAKRARALRHRGSFPAPSGRWPYPWPLL